MPTRRPPGGSLSMVGQGGWLTLQPRVVVSTKIIYCLFSSPSRYRHSFLGDLTSEPWRYSPVNLELEPGTAWTWAGPAPAARCAGGDRGPNRCRRLHAGALRVASGLGREDGGAVGARVSAGVDACFARDKGKALDALRLDPVCSHLSDARVRELGDRLLDAHAPFQPDWR